MKIIGKVFVGLLVCTFCLQVPSALAGIGDFFEDLKSGNRKFIELWDKYLDYLAIVINNLIMVYDCRVIVGGYVGSFIEPYIDILREKVEKRNTFEVDCSYIEPCSYKLEASALGAALLQIDAFIGEI